MNEFKDIAEKLYKSSELPPLSERKQIIEELNEICYKKYNKFLNAQVLSILGEWLIKELLVDTSSNKLSIIEYPILSKHQLKRRQKRLVYMMDDEKLAVLAYHLKNSSTIRKDKCLYEEY